jgi:6-phosphogluconate dehydrogenase (decarboxylating)
VPIGTDGRFLADVGVVGGEKVFDANPLVEAALFDRFASRGRDDFANQVLSAMREQFGGHQERNGGEQ